MLSAFLSRALLFSATLVAAQDTTTAIIYPTTAAPTATIVPGIHSYEYAGCWNETLSIPDAGGIRALSNGNISTTNNMTISTCLDFCSAASMRYAGLEYGRECYCAPYLSSLSEKLNETARCNFACNGNGSEICGGMNALTLYNRTSSDATRGVAWGGSVPGGGAIYGLAALVSLGFAAYL